MVTGRSTGVSIPELFNHSKRKTRTVKEALTDSKWISDINHDMTVNLFSQFVDLVERLHGIELQPSQADKITWLHTSDGQYTARSAYLLQFVGKTSSMTAEYTWRAKAPPKCRFFTWLMLQNRVWTTARLLIREWPNEYFCPLCIRNLETIDHLHCCYSKAIWKKVGSWISAPALDPANWNQTADFGQWFVDMGNSGQGARREGVRSMVMLTAWIIWKERNNRIFNKSCRTHTQLHSVIQDEAKLWVLAGNKGLKTVFPYTAQQLGAMSTG
jgi:hypothetical protein